MSIGSDQDLMTTLKRVASVLKQAGIPFALAGGFAAYARGGTSSDHDVDFLLREADVETALKALADSRFQVIRPPEDWLVQGYHEHPVGGPVFPPRDPPGTPQTPAG